MPFKVKERIAVLTMLYKKNGAVTGVGSDFIFISDWALHLARTIETACTIECRKVVAILGYPVGLD